MRENFTSCIGAPLEFLLMMDRLAFLCNVIFPQNRDPHDE